MEKAQESYVINSEDRELHTIDVILECLKRHLMPNENNLVDNELYVDAKKAMHRCVNFVSERIDSL